MVHYTTPELTFVIDNDGVDISSAENIYVTFKQNTSLVTKTGEDISVEDGNTIKVWLSQEESAYFIPGPVSIQINWTFLDGDGKLQRVSTGIKQVQITQNLLPRVVD